MLDPAARRAPETSRRLEMFVSFGVSIRNASSRRFEKRDATQREREARAKAERAVMDGRGQSVVGPADINKLCEWSRWNSFVLLRLFLS